MQVKPVTVGREVGSDASVSGGLIGSESIIIGENLKELADGDQVESGGVASFPRELEYEHATSSANTRDLPIVESCRLSRSPGIQLRLRAKPAEDSGRGER